MLRRNLLQAVTAVIVISQVGASQAGVSAHEPDLTPVDHTLRLYEDYLSHWQTYPQDIDGLVVRFDSLLAQLVGDYAHRVNEVTADDLYVRMAQCDRHPVDEDHMALIPYLVLQNVLVLTRSQPPPFRQLSNWRAWVNMYAHKMPAVGSARYPHRELPAHYGS